MGGDDRSEQRTIRSEVPEVPKDTFVMANNDNWDPNKEPDSAMLQVARILIAIPRQSVHFPLIVYVHLKISDIPVAVKIFLCLVIVQCICMIVTGNYYKKVLCPN